MENSRLATLFLRYTSNAITQTEKEEFFELLSKPGNDEQVKMLMDKLWETIPEENPQITIHEKHLNKILAKSGPAIPINRSSQFAWLQKVAAVLLVAVLATGTMYFFSAIEKNSNDQRATENSVPEHNFINLPDGSTVILNADSKLDFPESFNNLASREVYLTGEGFFDIKHNDSKPFIVHTGKISTTVLGTAFNVKALPGEDDITVTVARGKVKVSENNKILGIIERDQQITFNKESAFSSQTQVNSKQTIAWIERDIFFDDVTLEAAVEQLEERFQVTVQFQNENLKTCRFTATFIKGEDLKQILQVICEFNHATFNYNEENQVVKIEGPGCNHN
jgi:transmembrane sensor